MTTGQRIRAARKQVGLTQKELGEKLGIAYQTVAQWENNLRNPKIETLQKIAAALGVEAIELVPEEKQDEYLFSYVQYRKECKEKGIPIIPEWTVPPATPAEYYRARIGYFYDIVLNEAGQEKAAEAVEIIAGNPDYQRESWKQATAPPESPPPPQEAPPSDAPKTPPEGK